ncbi:MAG: serine hydrolase domain-containing protein [Candidatus Pristimantibacillus sp.]
MSNTIWNREDASTVGLDPTQLNQFERAISKHKILSCLIIKDDHLVFEYYKNLKCEDKLHKINSCTKSIMSALIGIAVEQGIIPTIETPIASYFPSLNRDPDERKRMITIEHLLTMSAGFDWPEFGEWQGFPRMIHDSNWIRYTLNRNLLEDPGDAMNYNSGCSHLLTAILQQASGMDAEQYARKYLFGPLGINEFRWYEDAQGIKQGGFGLCMTTRDIAKFGCLYLNNGKCHNKQLVPTDWIASTTVPCYLTYPYIGHYAKHWWTSNDEGLGNYYFALGFGGQYIVVVPEANMVIAMNSDLYEDSLLPMRMIRDCFNSL